MRRVGWTILSLVALLGLSLAAVAQAEGDEKIEKIGHGEVNWTARTVTTTGSCAPNIEKRQASIAMIRLEAERCATLSAYRNMLEVLKGVHVDGSTTVAEEMSADNQIVARVSGQIRGCTRVDTAYYSDGGVDIVLRCPLDGKIGQAITPTAEQQATVPTTGERRNTGLLVDARGLQVKPALAPRLLDEAGQPVYGPSFISPEGLETNGLVAYLKSFDKAKTHSRIGDKPLVVKALRAEQGGADLVISNADSAKLRDSATDLSYLRSGSVIIVTD